MTKGASGTIRLGIDGRTLEPPRTGVGRTVVELCRALHDTLPADTEYFVYARRSVEMPVACPRWTMRAEPVRAFARLPASAWLKFRAGVLARRDALDVFWAAAALAPGPRWRVPMLATVHDLCHHVAPATMPAGLRRVQQLVFASDVRRAAAVVAVSRGTAERLAEHVGVIADAVVPPAASPAFRPPARDEIDRVRAQLGLARPYFLSVATQEPRKNLGLLVAAYARARATDTTGAVAAHDLVLVGAGGWGDVRVDATPGVRQLGYVQDEALPALYAGATAFVFPSQYEGYGLPVLEARQCGAPVIASDTPEIREAGGVHGVTYVRPQLGALTCALIEASTQRDAAHEAVTPSPRVQTWTAAARVYADLFTRLAHGEPAGAVTRSPFAPDAQLGARVAPR